MPLLNSRNRLCGHVSGGEWSKYSHVAMAALSSLPWVAIVISAAQTFTSENAQESNYRAMYLWMKAHQEKLKDVFETLQEIIKKLESLGRQFEDRINSEEYLSLVRITFTRWDHTETTEKRRICSGSSLRTQPA